MANIQYGQADQALLSEAMLDNSKSAMIKIDQNTNAVEAVRKLVEQGATPKDAPVLQLDKQLFFQALNKKVVANSDTLRKILDQFQLMQQAAPSTETKEFDDGAEKISVEAQPMKIIQSYEDMSLEQYLQTALGQKLGSMLALMDTPENQNWERYELWWVAQKTRWTKKENHLPQWYRAVSWWATQFMDVWVKVITDFMTNPFQTTLQEICHQATLVKNVLTQMGFILKNNDTKFKWVEPFITLGKSGA